MKNQTQFGTGAITGKSILKMAGMAVLAAFLCVGCVDKKDAEHIITFDANGGTVTPQADTTDAGGRLTYLPTPTRDGYTFNGWFTAATDGTAVTTSTVFKNDTPIYAQWTLRTHTISFIANGGTVTPNNDLTGDGWKLASLPTPIKDGYTFSGWFTADTDGEVITTSTVFTKNTAVYAQWTLNTYTITFDVNASDGSLTPTSGTTGEGWKLASLPTPTKTGYMFKGWYTAAAGGTEVTTSTVFTANTTIYAQWQRPRGNDISNYRTVTIGTQTWMAENLDYDVTGSVCYNNSEYNCAKYGRLYTWETAMGGASSSSESPSGVQGVCPVGWHLPSDAEWDTLITTVGDALTAGTKLKATSGWVNFWDGTEHTDEQGTDDYGFSALPGSSGDQWNGYFAAAGTGVNGLWWSSTEYSPGYSTAWYRNMNSYDEDVVKISNCKCLLLSVRCVQD